MPREPRDGSAQRCLSPSSSSSYPSLVPQDPSLPFPSDSNLNERSSRPPHYSPDNISSSSDLADDERSSYDPSNMGPDAGRDEPQYEGEETRLTSTKELSGFYAYGWAAEVATSTYSIMMVIQHLGKTSLNMSAGLCRLRHWYVPVRRCMASPAYRYVTSITDDQGLAVL